MKIGILADVHANARALDAGLTALRTAGAERLVFLGDLLSYGPDPLRVIELLQGAARTTPTSFIVGNHDQLYFELQRGERGYYSRMPPWIQESARFTVDALGSTRLEALFPWLPEIEVGDVLLSHANPFGAGDWTYLNADDARTRAAATLRARGFNVGVFGHTHREVDVEVAGVRLLNPGSVGQPRDARGISSVGLWSDAGWRLLPLAYDERGHCEAVRQMGLSAATTREILKFHVAVGAGTA